MKPESAKTSNCSIASLLLQARQHLPHLDDGRRDAEYLLAHVIGQSRTWLLTWPEKIVDIENARRFDELVQNRARGMPLAYLTGQREFWSLPLTVNRATLIPRPETERLVELALQHAVDTSVIIELGTGSGAIALALASELPDRTIIATDCSDAALVIAQDNANALNCRLQFVLTDWLTGFLPECTDLVVSNPPYIAIGDPHLSGDGVLFEPAMALLGGADGLDAFRQIIPQATRCLRGNGRLLLEHGHEQAAAVRELMTAAGFTNVTTYNDAAGLNRVSLAILDT